MRKQKQEARVAVTGREIVEAVLPEAWIGPTFAYFNFAREVTGFEEATFRVATELLNVVSRLGRYVE